MSSNSNGTAVPGSSSILPPTETITATAQIGQGDAASWNFENLEVHFGKSCYSNT